MNLTITTTSITRRRGLRHAALALCAVLVALVAASCTADALDGTDTGAPSPNNPDDVLTFAVGTRPGFTEAAATRGTGTTAPATRAEQTPGATRWEQGDILWLIARFFHNKQDYVPGAVPDTIHVSALKYDGAAWRYLTVDEAADLHTANIPNFVRLLRWPPESAGWSDPGMKVSARYLGTGTPDTDGIITITPQGGIPVIPAIEATSELSVPGEEPVSLQFFYDNSRIRIPAGYAAKFNGFHYHPTFMPSNDRTSIGFWDSNLPAQQQDTDVFLYLTGGSSVTLTRDGVSCSFDFPPLTDAEGNPITDKYGDADYAGASYTLTPYTSGAETPGGYDLTVADEAGLRAFAQAVNAGDRLPNGKPAVEARVLQTADIELTQEWVPIGYSRYNTFRGAYNGNGHEISGLTIKTMPQPDADQGGVPMSCAGLFGYAERAVLTGIRLRKVEINILVGSGAGLSAGSIAGHTMYSTLSLCSADGTVNVSNGTQFVHAGGIVGYNTFSTISRCRADVETKAVTTNADGPISTGGIAGRNTAFSFILSCETGDRSVTAEGSGWVFAGGIAGENGISLIAFCRTGKNLVTARDGNDKNYAGGLAGQNNNGILVSCYSRATAKATGAVENHAGAIVGYNYADGNVQHCYGAGATDQGTSNLGGDPAFGIVYNANPGAGEIFGVMTNYTGKVESIIDRGTTSYPFTTHYDPSATPAYGIIPRRAVWKSDGAWNIGDGTYPKLNIEEYEGK